MAPRVLRHFPYPLNVGTDICNIVRVRQILGSPKGPRFIRKILHSQEYSNEKVFWILQDDPGWKGPKSKEKTREELLVEFSTARLEKAANFMAGRYVYSTSLDNSRKQGLIVTSVQKSGV